MEQILINLVAGALGGVGVGKSSPTIDLGMSALCQKRTYASQHTAHGLRTLFDITVGAREQRGRHDDAKRPSGLEISSRPSGSSFVLDCADDRREYRAASASGDCL